jgi:hypothetical protein
MTAEARVSKSFLLFCQSVFFLLEAGSERLGKRFSLPAVPKLECARPGATAGPGCARLPIIRPDLSLIRPANPSQSRHRYETRSGAPHAFHTFSQFQIPLVTSIGNGNPS